MIFAHSPAAPSSTGIVYSFVIPFFNEVEGAADDMGSITFQSDKDGMTVVYLFNREPISMINSK